MHILADENIPLVDEFFAGFGEIRRMPGRSINRAALENVDVLLVRSVTRVDREMLEGSAVRFVGTCTIGTDHLDLDYFEQAGIEWASAPGCNARGVVDYVLGSLLALSEVRGEALARRRFGVVGAGEVGGRLLEVLRGLGWDVRVCDPPRQVREAGDFVSLDEILAECDVISLHTPLTLGGDWPTFHLFDQARLSRLRPGTWLINASRGAVVDNAALRDLLLQRPDLEAVLDVWEGEPQVDVALAGLCRIATPHIAGYSLDGKLRGTAQIYAALCAARGVEPAIELAQLMPGPALTELVFASSAEPAEMQATLCRAVYDPRRDDADFRRSLLGNEAQRRAGFDLLRKQYPPRREIDGLKVRIGGHNPALATIVEALGARLLG
ncbi:MULTISPECIES: 4-phosphoerythronate dehydrogenase PdxB [Stutzerimonas stutzeri subgroup]|uniref:Erythronate-4-phosphate dehydrogenase n=1 Tax=Stutzerimonas stutzeri CCUG 29243 TaxID=1196835 RepID=I4CU26_STUST|nr:MULTISPECIES: 4-phosphoerythronate dehydrogenase PdxB [Stutzerimonas stutzeri subgroup]AFM33583.1 erythronate-4-phosphate dehydrogenase [Stutzerimonas stutzeri CCUG 29243]MCQ2038124.1 4-phosphoerythronate dehydrogenase PdxB [Stutzerimonas kunmingensis]MCQ2048949.1 4-phosphoerythronate dehydrogenase PdxB [Stutzerimonas kunmingensis]PKR26635.1 4-phosphoerythronate dehydrogenase PdxB [Stutzerimonas stutzeri]QQC09439.1 4-phosphoerythronate dehydrogenase PdxB [Stutzerimonas stutzeri]